MATLMSDAIDQFVPMHEDPRREPHEKETAISIDGDADKIHVTSYKKVVYSKLLKHSDFELTWLQVCDKDGNERQVDDFGPVTNNTDLTVIGVSGTLPVGSLSIGVARNSDSHAEIVKL